MKRSNNDLRDWLDEGGARIPKGDNGAGAWVNDPATVKRVRELYKPSSEMRAKMESDRRIFLTAMAKINEGMILGVDKNALPFNLADIFRSIVWVVAAKSNRERARNRRRSEGAFSRRAPDAVIVNDVIALCRLRSFFISQEAGELRC